MSYIRLAGIPIDHLVAEIAAFPIASEASLKLGAVELSPWLSQDSRVVHAATARLWRAAESALIAHAPNVSLDELTAMRDRTWFREGAHHEVQSQPLHKYVRTLAQRHLRVRGKTAVPCLQLDHWHDGLDSDALSKARSREAWRWLTFALPPDFLLAALASDDGFPTRVETLSPQLEETLHRHGFAEAHLHIGAGLEFPLLWVSTVVGLRSSQLHASSFESPGADLDEGRHIGGWLIRAAIARYVLAAFLRRRTSVSENPKPDQKPNPLKAFVDSIREELIDSMGLSNFQVLHDALLDLSLGEFVSNVSYAELQNCYTQLTQGCQCQMPSRAYPVQPGDRVLPDERPQLDAAFFADPLATFFPAGSEGSPTPEMQFLWEGFEYATWLDKSHSKGRQNDSDFLVLFWQVVRVRNLFYRHVVQRPMTPGLQWFIRTYARLGAGRRSIGVGLQLESAAMTSGFGRGLRALEVRTCSEHSSSDLLELVDELDDHFRLLNEDRQQHLVESDSHLTSGRVVCRDDCELGVVLHFAKDRGGGARQGRANGFWIGSHADPSTIPDIKHGQHVVTNPTGYRYASYYQQTVRSHAQTVGKVLIDFPQTLAVIRGIDVCTDELGVPSWVIAPAFRYLHDVSSQVSAELWEGQRMKVPPLRVTVHAGEDFVHLLTGLRNIAWSIRFLGLREGDRIGHGVALGVDATQWAKSAGRIAVMREERLFDLLFEWHCYAADHVPMTENRRTYLDREIARLSQAVFKRTLHPYELETLVELLHDEQALAEVGFPDGQSRPIGRLMRNPEFPDSVKLAKQLLRKYLMSPSLFHRGRALEWLDPASEAAALETLQDYLRQRVGTLGLAVEANVSSNLLLANLGTIENHPLFRLSPPAGGTGKKPVSVVFGSDDPLTFATNLPNEFMLARDAILAGEGLSDAEANAWLRQVAEDSLRFRFSQPRPNIGSLRESFPTASEKSIWPLL